MAVTSRPISADPRARLNAARLAETKVPLPRTAAGRTPMLSAGQLAAVYDRMYSQAEESRLNAQQREREQRRDMREQCTCLRGPEDQSAIVHRLAVKDVGERRTNAQMRAARTARVQAAQQLSNVVALDRDAKTKLHEGRPPAAPQAPTRLAVFGTEVLDLPDDEWDALVASDHGSPQAMFWSFVVPK